MIPRLPSRRSPRWSSYNSSLNVRMMLYSNLSCVLCDVLSYIYLPLQSLQRSSTVMFRLKGGFIEITPAPRHPDLSPNIKETSLPSRSSSRSSCTRDLSPSSVHQTRHIVLVQRTCYQKLHGIWRSPTIESEIIRTFQ